ncbi:MAG: hypothetical protein HYX68_19010 [Planctomycetes bacterium]|nr:hypothetical protein [Planctomycetota bacterium]
MNNNGTGFRSYQNSDFFYFFLNWRLQFAWGGGVISPKVSTTIFLKIELLMFSLIARCLGLLLLTAAGLKIYGFGVDPVARLGIFSAPAFQFLVIVFEILLGLWWVSGVQPLGACCGSFNVSGFRQREFLSRLDRAGQLRLPRREGQRQPVDHVHD